MYNPYQYNYPQGQQNFMQPWTQQNQMQQPMWQQPAQQLPPTPQPEPQPQPVMQQPSDLVQVIHRLCDILEAMNAKGGINNV